MVGRVGEVWFLNWHVNSRIFGNGASLHMSVSTVFVCTYGYDTLSLHGAYSLGSTPLGLMAQRRLEIKECLTLIDRK